METFNLDSLSITSLGLCTCFCLLPEEAFWWRLDKAPLYEHSRISLGSFHWFILLDFIASHVWFYPRSLICFFLDVLFFGSRLSILSHCVYFLCASLDTCGTGVEVRGQHARIYSLLCCGFWGLNSGLAAIALTYWSISLTLTFLFLIRPQLCLILASPEILFCSKATKLA